LIHEIENICQKKCELDEDSEHLNEKLEMIERERADTNNKINYCDKEMERERNLYKAKYDALHK
jgi:kinetochore protein Nuf2